ncbi:peptidase S8/S53 domain-containing protein [Mycena rebaudengoi]|nr:peptidase S8/S53 domain-containing protein [Mycena rebaudengoi]
MQLKSTLFGIVLLAILVEAAPALPKAPGPAASKPPPGKTTTKARPSASPKPPVTSSKIISTTKPSSSAKPVSSVVRSSSAPPGVSSSRPSSSAQSSAISSSIVRGSSSSVAPSSALSTSRSASSGSISVASSSAASLGISASGSTSGSASLPVPSGISSGISSASGSISASVVSESGVSGSLSASASGSASSGSVNASSTVSSSASPSGSSCPFPRPSGGPKNKTKRAVKAQNNAHWALARIAQANKLTNVGTDSDGDDSDGFPLPPKRARSQDWNFPYDDTWGQDVVVYIVDSGVRKTHVELAGRVEDGWVLPRLTGVATEDVCEHGTAVASLVAGNTLGVARKATIVPVRIADKASCKKVTTTTDDVTAGINWAITDFKARCSAKAGIINISWEIYQTPASEKAFTDAMAAGIHVVVSAGNLDKNQCFGEGAAADDERVKPVGQFIVGNSDFEDKRSSLLTQELGSNFGKCVTIWAPGTSLNVASGKDDTTIEHGGFGFSGTSFSAPLLAGTIAAYVSAEGNKLPPAMKTFILGKAKSAAGIQDLQESPDIMLQAPILSTTTQ